MTDTATAHSGLAVFGEFAPDGQEAYDNAVTRFREKNIVLPTFAELRDPSTIPSGIVESLTTVEKDAPDARTAGAATRRRIAGRGPGPIPACRARFPHLSSVPEPA